MEIKRKTEITVETSRHFVVRRIGKSGEQLVCPRCAEPMLAAEQVAATFGISRRAVYRHIETGAAHFAEIETGAVMICLASLTAILETGERFLSEAETRGE